MQRLLELTQRDAVRSTYLEIIKATEKELNTIEVLAITKSSQPSGYPDTFDDKKETQIIETLSKMVPSAGLSYKQACIDLRTNDRISYRGSATELREALREILSHLAPDKDVLDQPNFKLEKDQKKPTMKQKVHFILKSRGKSKSLAETPEKAVSVIEDSVGELARSVYNRSSLSTHLGTTQTEVNRIKDYVDVVLCDLLEIS